MTALMPGPTDTNFFVRAGMADTSSASPGKDDPADVARQGYEAMMAGKDHVVSGGFLNKAKSPQPRSSPDPMVAAMHGSMSRHGSGSGKSACPGAGAHGFWKAVPPSALGSGGWGLVRSR